MGRKRKPDQLDIDASNAIKMGMSYGRYMALVKQPTMPVKKKEKKKKPSGHCLCCGAEIFWSGVGKEKKYCDEVCREEYYRAQKASSAKVPETRTCKICGKEFPKYRHQMYCSEACVRQARAENARRLRKKKRWGE